MFVEQGICDIDNGTSIVDAVGVQAEFGTLVH